MTVANSSKGQRPDKPYDGYPLFAHNNGQWCRKILGIIYSFGPWRDPEAALRKHNHDWPYLRDGVTPPPTGAEGWTVDKVVNKYLTVKKRELEAGEISQRWYDDLKECGELVVASINRKRLVETLVPDDFRRLRSAIMKPGRSPGVAKNKIQRVKSFFRFAWDEQLISHPVRFGRGFDPPKQQAIRRYRSSKPKRLYTPAEVKAFIAKASIQLQAMIRLSLNAGLNNSDICHLPASAIDVRSGWMDFPRVKTGVERRAKLSTATVKAVKAAMAQRAGKHDGTLVFITQTGRQWGSRDISHEFARIRKACGMEHGGFSWLRHCFQTIAEDGTRDLTAVRAVMGHTDTSISAFYREGTADNRLIAVSKAVQTWLDRRAK